MSSSRPSRDPRVLALGRLLGTAQRLFLTRGFRATSIAEIARAVDMDEQAFTRHAASKDDLLVKLFERIEHDLIHEMVERIALSGPTAKDKLVAFLDEKVVLGRSYVSDTVLRIMMLLEFADPHEPLGARVRALHGHVLRAVEGIVDLGKFRGQFRGDLATRELAAMVVAAHDGILLEYHRSGGALDGPQLVKALQFSLVRGLEERIDPSPDRTRWSAPGHHP